MAKETFFFGKRLSVKNPPKGFPSNFDTYHVLEHFHRSGDGLVKAERVHFLDLDARRY